MSKSGAVERWAARQKSKALHLGTYEAAIENMFRRMRDQGDDDTQFYLYRAQLTSECVIEPGVHAEPTNWLGDAQLAEVCAPHVQAFRYVNVHEEPSSVSLAIDLSAIHAVQGIAIPLPVDPANMWVLEATARLQKAASEPPPLSKGKLQSCASNLFRILPRRPASSKQRSVSAAIGSERSIQRSLQQS
jgi:hypothetical protein